MQVKAAHYIPPIVTAKLKYYHDMVAKDPDSGKYGNGPDKKRKACELDNNPEITAGS